MTRTIFGATVAALLLAACNRPEAPAAPARSGTARLALLDGATCAGGDGCMILGCTTPDSDCHIPPGADWPIGGSGGSGGSGAATVRVLTYNIHHATDPFGNIELDDVVARINQASPHLACLQEVDRNAIRTGFVDQAGYIASHAASLPHYVYVPVGSYGEITEPPYIDQADGPELADLYADTLGVAGERGIAVLSRYPILASYEWSFEGDFQPRSIVAVAVDAPGVGLVLGLCTHFPTGPEGVDGRAEMISWLNENATISMPTFLMGDLNARAGWDEIADLEALWENSAASPILTHPASGPKHQLDYVMSRNSGAVDVDAAIVSGVHPSDHRPLLATYTLPAGVGCSTSCHGPG